MIKTFELLSFAVSAAAFGCAAFYFFRPKTPKYFQLYACAAGCYMLEELWVIVNSLLGNGSRDGLVTVRLVGFFGCLCFMLSANINGFDKLVDEGQDRKARALAYIAPVLLLVLYALYGFSPLNAEPVPVIVIGLISISPALVASYFNLKHLLLPKDETGFLDITEKINAFALIFYVINYAYPLAYLHCPNTLMSAYDLLLTAILFVIVILCRKGAEQWKALI